MTQEGSLIKNYVKEKYSEIARKNSSGCGCSCCGDDPTEYAIVKDEYSNLEGYEKDADLGLGCGIPTQLADIKPGETVLDLGSGAGNDVFVARSIVGESGKVIGVDFSDDMLALAESNNSKLGYKNIEFLKGEIENLPVEDDSVDVVISNCVLNLVPDKSKAFSEIHRVLRESGHFTVSDIVLSGEIPEKLKKSAELYVGCVSGALQEDDYLNTIREAAFSRITVGAKSRIELPEELLKSYLGPDEIELFHRSDFGIYSITVTGVK